MNDLILALDVGTQSVRAVLIDAEGSIAALEKEPLPPWHSPQPGWAELPPEVYWQCLCTATRRLWAARPEYRERLAAVTLTTQRGTIVLLDQNGQPLYPAVLWLDQRRAETLAPLPWFWRAVFRLSGQSSTIDYLRRQAEVNWFYAHLPAVWQQAAKVLFLSGYLTYLLTGEYTDSTACQVGYLPFDYRRQQWAGTKDWKWHALAVRPEQLPRLVPPGEVLGVISRRAADATGIPCHLPLIAAAADKACEVLGTGCLDVKQASISYGTTATINTNSRRYIEPHFLYPPYPSAVPGWYNIEYQVYSGFWLVTWFINEFGYRELTEAQARGITPEKIYDDLIAAVPPGSEGLVVQPFWMPGLRYPGLEARGAVVGFRPHHGRPHFYRALLEGIAFALLWGRENIERRTRRPVRTLYVSGGGARSEQVLRITAGIFNLPVLRPHTWETAALGAAVVAAVSSRWFNNYEEAVRNMVHYREPIVPAAEEVQIYREIYEKVYSRLYRRLRPLYRSLKTFNRHR